MDRRRDERYPAHLAAAIVVRAQDVATSTDNVSFHGLFLYSAGVLQLGQLSRLVITPPDEDPISLHVVPVRCVPVHGSMGMGVRLLGVPERWERLVGHFRDASPSGMRIRLACQRASDSVPRMQVAGMKR